MMVHILLILCLYIYIYILYYLRIITFSIFDIEKWIERIHWVVRDLTRNINVSDKLTVLKKRSL